VSQRLKLHARVLRRCRIIKARLQSLKCALPRSPIIVLGNQKSGTTAIASLLAMYIGKTVTLDIPPLWFALEKLLVMKSELRSFARTYSLYFSRPVIKEPWLTFLVTELMEVFPRARYVLIVRDPRDNIRSILDRLDIRGDTVTNPPELDQLPQGWREAFDRKLLGCDSIHYIDMLAHRWNSAAGIPQQQSRLPVSVNVFRYEDFVKDKQGSIADLAAALDEERGGDISAYLDKSFQPKGTRRHLSWEEFFGAANLKRIEGRCGKLMQVYGYHIGRQG